MKIDETLKKISNKTNIAIRNGNYFYQNTFQKKKKLKLFFQINKRKGNELVTGKLAANITVK